MLGKDALDALVEYGWFTRRSDGQCFAVKVPSQKDLGEFVRLVARVATHTVSLRGEPSPIETSAASRDTGPFFRVRES